MDNNTSLLGLSATGHITNVIAVPVSSLTGPLHYVFDIPQVVNLTYQANTDYTTAGYSGYSADLLTNDPLNRTDFRLVQGVANEVLFFVRDSARLPVPNANLTLNLTSRNGLMRIPLTLLNNTTGLYRANLQPPDVAMLPLGPIAWSVSYQRPNLSTVLLWTDRNSPYSNALVNATPIPATSIEIILWADFSPLTAPPGFGFPIPAPQYYSSPLLGAAQRPYAFGVQSFVISMTEFTGTIEVDATLWPQPDNSASSADWFPLQTTTYTKHNVDETITIHGNYMWIRMVVSLIAGSVDQVQYATNPPTRDQAINGVASIADVGFVTVS